MLDNKVAVMERGKKKSPEEEKQLKWTLACFSLVICFKCLLKVNLLEHLQALAEL